MVSAPCGQFVFSFQFTKSGSCKLKLPTKISNQECNGKFNAESRNCRVKSDSVPCGQPVFSFQFSDHGRNTYKI